MRSSRRGVFAALGLPCLASLLLLVAGVAVLLAGCAADGDVTTTAAPPPEAATQPTPGKPDPAVAEPGGPQSSNLVVTDRERGYLNALAAAGVHASSEVVALSIGSSVCQAKAAGQNDQAVWDFVFPLVRGDLHDLHPEATETAMSAQVHDATAAYIRTATTDLC